MICVGAHAKEANGESNQVSQKSVTVDEYESLVLEHASKTALDMKDSTETIPPCEKFNKQLQFLQTLFKKLLTDQGYSEPEIRPKDVDTNDFLSLESAML
jgi:hypothetical protein